MLNVSISPKAEAEIWRHAEFLSRVNYHAAENLVDMIYSNIFQLEKTALSYPLFYNNFRKISVEERYAVFYVVIGNEVNIDRIYDMRTEEYNNIILERNDSL